MTLDIQRGDADFLHRYSEYRNAMAKVLGVRLKRIWTRKAMGEEFLAQKVAQEMKELRAMIEACGDLPPAGDAEAMLAYAKKVVAWTERLDAEEAKNKRK